MSAERNLSQWLDFISEQHVQTIDMGLERMHTMVQRLQLQQPAPKIITVAGTNGKGSTSLACEALLVDAGVSVGTTLSPHIHRFNERVRLNGQEVADDALCLAFQAVEDARQELPVTYFEFAALAALWTFKHNNVDVAILEIGLGGRLDAFNAVDADVAVITSIGIDHQEFLGDSVEVIGAEKAGILRSGQKVVLGEQMPESIMQCCNELALNPLQVGQALQLHHSPHGWRVVEDSIDLADIPYGACAPHNLALAYLAVQQLYSINLQQLIKVSAQLEIPGRMQSVKRMGRHWVLDVAHNPAGVAFCAKALAHRQWQPRMIVCAMLAGKDHAGVVETLAKQIHAPINTPNTPWRLLSTEGDRALAAEDFAAQVADIVEHLQLDLAPRNWSSLIAEVNTATQPGDVILVLGSFNLIEQFDQVDFELPV